MLNFDWKKVIWSFNWCDTYYFGWGSPTCPEEEHSHRFGEKHWVTYQQRASS